MMSQAKMGALFVLILVQLEEVESCERSLHMSAVQLSMLRYAHSALLQHLMFSAASLGSSLVSKQLGRAEEACR